MKVSFHSLPANSRVARHVSSVKFRPRGRKDELLHYKYILLGALVPIHLFQLLISSLWCLRIKIRLYSFEDFRRFSKESRKELWNFEGSLRIKLFEKWKTGIDYFCVAKYTFLLEGRRLTWYGEFDTPLCLQPDLHRVYIYIWCFACTYYSISRFLQTVKTYFARKKKKNTKYLSMNFLLY